MVSRSEMFLVVSNRETYSLDTIIQVITGLIEHFQLEQAM